MALFYMLTPDTGAIAAATNKISTDRLIIVTMTMIIQSTVVYAAILEACDLSSVTSKHML